MGRANDRVHVEVHQMCGPCVGVYVKLPGAWQGTRLICHLHRGECAQDCEANCQGFNPQVAVLALMVLEWAEACKPIIRGDLQTRSATELVSMVRHALGKRRRTAGRKR
jgi:hypothetical protein